ncbi:hypothetical protein BIY22_03410 [Vibrio panuliri]|uniref:Uncharacterized protein n=1 Tax=Vibrio panuliri TaxID=1381081 RepID=A0A1Q9HRS1_9VIBR|nr:hypothetical protein [Vibrio panuliri]OLQ93553.1 hypothetical protein BIY22_03410 [Vibrio panuliri]
MKELENYEYKELFDALHLTDFVSKEVNRALCDHNSENAMAYFEYVLNDLEDTTDRYAKLFRALPNITDADTAKIMEQCLLVLGDELIESKAIVDNAIAIISDEPFELLFDGAGGTAGAVTSGSAEPDLDTLINNAIMHAREFKQAHRTIVQRYGYS